MFDKYSEYKDPFPHIPDGYHKKAMEDIYHTLGKLEAEEFELREKLNLNLATQRNLSQALKWGEEVHKSDERLDRDLKNSQAAAAGMLKLFVSKESQEFFGDLQRGREEREKETPTAGLS